jgi:hypothetical protein
LKKGVAVLEKNIDIPADKINVCSFCPDGRLSAETYIRGQVKDFAGGMNCWFIPEVRVRGK